MSDHERGAYTPQPDAPLSFDARVPRDQRPLPILLIASCLILAAMVVAGFLLYRSGVRGQNEPPRPVGEPIANIKSAPAPEEAGNTVGAPTATGAAPNFAPAPEQPLNRTAAAAPGLTVQTAPEPQVKLAAAPPPPPPQAAPQAAPPPAPVAAAPKPVEHKPVLASAPETPAKPAPKLHAAAAPPKETFGPETRAVAQPAPVKPAPVKAAPVKTAAVKAPAPVSLAKGAVVVQIGAYVSEPLAQQGWEKVAGLMGGEIHGHGRRVEPVSVGGSTRYRSQVTGFATRAEAASFCTALKGKGHDCIVKAGE